MDPPMDTYQTEKVQIIFPPPLLKLKYFWPLDGPYGGGGGRSKASQPPQDLPLPSSVSQGVLQCRVIPPEDESSEARPGRTIS